MAFLQRCVVLVASVLAAGCGDTASSTKCTATCQAPTTGPCAGQDESACRSQCEAMTSGLKTECVQCIVEHSGWEGIRCTCIGTPCTTCGFSSGGAVACKSPAVGEECTAAQEMCSGFEIYKASGSQCTAFCGAATHDASTGTGKPSGPDGN